MLDLLPDAVLQRVLSFLPPKSLGWVRESCRIAKEVGFVDDLWHPLFAKYYPVDVAYAASTFDAFPERQPWFNRYRSWAALQDRWRGKRPGCTQASASFSSGNALFCMNSLGDGRFICTGAEGVVRIIARDGPGRVRVTSEFEAGEDGHGHLGMAVDIAAQTVATCG
jgi:hypothetical protein